MLFPRAHSTPGVLHYVPPNLSLFEPTKPIPSNGPKPAVTNAIIWIGGLFDTLQSVTYPFTLARSLPPHWTLLTASLSSAGPGWGTSSIANDAAEIARLVTYVQEILLTIATSAPTPRRVILMGHSTGCQDCMAYLLAPPAAAFPEIAGAILQAPVSDREALDLEMAADARAAADAAAGEMVAAGRGADALPTALAREAFPWAPQLAVSAQRWLDVSSPPPAHDGADDFFSSDLDNVRLAETFGRVGRRAVVCFLMGGEDEAVPASVEKESLLGRWVEAVRAGAGKVDERYSGVVPGASHNLNGQADDIVQGLVSRVLGFVARLDAGDFEAQM